MGQQTVVLDEGNSIIKGKNLSREVFFQHGLKELTDTDWRHIKLRGGDQHPDFVKVNGVPYVVGPLADDYGFTGHLKGSARYTETYYGVFAAVVLFRLYEKNMRNITVFASHAPQDIEYRPDLIASVKKHWRVESMGQEREFEVNHCFCFDEPVGGMMNQLINEEATGYYRSELREGEMLAIDVGGFTTDVAVLRDGKVIHNRSHSEEAGILEVERDFRKMFLEQHAKKFKGSSKPKSERIREALRTGAYDGGGYGLIDCTQEAEHATNRLIRTVHDIYTDAGGTATFRYVLLTGGGSALLEERLVDVLGHPNVFLADDIDSLHLANVRGGLKMIKFWNREGLL